MTTQLHVGQLQNVALHSTFILAVVGTDILLSWKSMYAVKIHLSINPNDVPSTFIAEL